MNKPVMNKPVLALLVLLLTSFSVTAEASPWTLPRGDAVITTAFDFQLARREFMQDGGGSRRYPLDGRYLANTFFLQGRLGITDRLEVEIGLPLRIVSYESDPVILLERGANSMVSELDFYQDNTLNFTRTRAGVGDITVAARYALIRPPFPLALEVQFKMPTGYSGRQGTFGERPETTQEFLDNIGTVVDPDNIGSGDITLGDAQLDVRTSLLFGHAFPSRTFIRADLGYNLRLAGAGDEIRAGFKVGQLLGSRILIFAETRLCYAVQNGRVVGVSVAAEDPNLPAQDYGGLTNLVLREQRLDRDALDIGGGMLVKLSDHVESFVGFNRTVWGRNAAAINSVYFGLAFRASAGPDHEASASTTSHDAAPAATTVTATERAESESESQSTAPEPTTTEATAVPMELPTSEGELGSQPSEVQSDTP